MSIETLHIKDLEDRLQRSCRKNINIPWELQPRNHLNAHYRYEMEVIAHLCQMQNPQLAFEFGTFEGFTTLVMAMNTSQDAIIYTLDLPLQAPIKTKFPLEHYNSTFVNARGLLHFKGTQYESKIHTIYTDSAEFDEFPLRDRVDLILVDGNHQKHYIENDTRKAFAMLNQKGILLWHDYKTGWPDVTPFLEALSSKKKLFHIKGTNYVMFKKEIQNPI